MKGVFLAPTLSTKNKQSKIKALAISAAHSSHMVLQYDFLSVILITAYFLGVECLWIQRMKTIMTEKKRKV